MKDKKNCIDACLACMMECEKCTTMSIEMGGMVECLEVCRDCADICALCAKLCARDSQFCDDVCALVVKCCEASVTECAKHGDHCKACTEAFKKCAEVCKM